VRKVSGVLGILYACVVAGAPVQASQSAAVNPQAYVHAIEAYTTGHPLTETVMTLQSWTRKDFEAVVDRLILARNVAQLEAAALLELEVGLGMMSVSPERAQIHFELGEKMLRSLTPTPPELRENPKRVEELHRLLSTWFGVAGSGYLWVTDISRATPWIRKALQLAPQSSTLKTLEGSAHEIDAAGFNPDRAQTLSQKARAGFDRAGRLQMAHDSFRDAVAADPLNAAAHIRLGRILFLLEKMTPAREEIERGEALATNPADAYLAALFLGGIQERQKDLAGARDSYTRALSFAPQSQTAIIALAHLELMAGRPDRAQTLARSFAAAPAEDPAWWAYRNGGLDLDGLESLRSRIRK